jgi:hypothetical protein
MIAVKFARNYRNYAAGEVAGFTDTAARQLIAAKIATPVEGKTMPAPDNKQQKTVVTK